MSIPAVPAFSMKEFASPPVARIVMGRVYGVTTKGRSLFSTRLDEIHSLVVCQSMIFG